MSDPCSPARTCSTCGAVLDRDEESAGCLTCQLSLGLVERNDDEGALPPEDEGSGGRSSRPLQLGEFTLLEEIARGGMGVVHRAWDRGHQRIVALKVLHGGAFASPDARKRLQQEAEALNRVSHPHIVTLHKIGNDGGQTYLAMTYVPGSSLSATLAEGPLSPPAAAALLATLARAVAEAHRQGVVHRDLKPSNILIDACGVPHVSDFGLAKLLSEEGEDLTFSGQLMGTPSYMAPEQAASEPGVSCEPAVDIYALGAVLYHCLTGRPPYQADSSQETLLQVLAGDLIHPRLLAPHVPRDLETICLKSLEKSPQNRYRSAGAMADDLDAFIHQKPIAARPARLFKKTVRWAAKKRGAATAWVLAALAIITGFGATYSQWRRAVHHGDERERMGFLMSLQRNEELFAAGRHREGLGSLATILQQHPETPIVGSRAVMSLLYHPYHLPVCPPLPGHVDTQTAAFSPEGQTLAVGGRGEVTLWKTAEGRFLTKALTGDQNTVHHLVLAPEMGILAGATASRLFLWDLDSGSLLETLSDLKAVSQLELDPSGNQIAALSESGSLILVQIQERPLSRRRSAPVTDVTRVAFSPDGTALCLGLNNGHSMIWHFSGRDHPAIRSLSSERSGRISAIAYSPDGRWLATGGWDSVVRIWDAHTGAEIGGRLEHDGAWIRAIAWSPNSERVASATQDGGLYVWDRGGTLIANRGRLGPGATRMAWYPDRRGILLATASGILGIEPDSLRSERALPAAWDGGRWGVWSEDGDRIATTADGETVTIWDSLPGAIDPALPPFPDKVSVSWSPDSTRILTLCEDGEARVWGARDREPISPPLPHPGTLRGGLFSPDGQFVLTFGKEPSDATHTRSGCLRVWDAGSGHLLAGPLFTERIIWSAAFSPDGNTIATGSWDGTAQLWDWKGGRHRLPPIQAHAAVMDVRFSADGELLATAGDPDSASVWEVGTGKLVWGPLKHRDVVTGVRFHPSRAWLATASRDRSLRLWDLETRQPLGLPLWHGGEVLGLEFIGAEGTRLAGMVGPALRLWNLETGTTVPLPYRLHHESLVRLSLSGNHYATTSSSGDVRLWDGPSGTAMGTWLHLSGDTSLSFSPNEEYVAAASSEGHVALLRVPPSIPGPVPAWFSNCLKAVSGWEFGEDGTSRPVEPEQLWRQRTSVLQRTPLSAYEELAQWFFADRKTRPITPWEKDP